MIFYLLAGLFLFHSLLEGSARNWTSFLLNFSVGFALLSIAIYSDDRPPED